MRLDKFICQSSEMSRTDAKKALKTGCIRVDGQIVKQANFNVQPEQQVCFNGEPLSLIGQRYIMLHKPEDMICSNVDEVHPSILHLIDLPKAFELNIAGRLDVDTTGLVLLSDDGKWTHQITSPRKKCPKIYQVVLAETINDDMVTALETGVQLHGEQELTLPAQVEVLTPNLVNITICEGKYHQVKRMFAAVNNKVLELHRLQIGAITLDENLPEGQWRYLTETEIHSI